MAAQRYGSAQIRSTFFLLFQSQPQHLTSTLRTLASPCGLGFIQPIKQGHGIPMDLDGPLVGLDLAGLGMSGSDNSTLDQRLSWPRLAHVESVKTNQPSGNGL
jgi:hypothetical protein